jgi:hypothetical protein
LGATSSANAAAATLYARAMKVPKVLGVRFCVARHNVPESVV